MYSCDPYENPLINNDTRPEILIYTGITMADAVVEIKDIYESNYACRASIMYGASGYLKSVINVNKVGDIYLPGNKSYIDAFAEDRIVTKVIDVGFNTLSMFVKKGNPLLLNGDLAQLTNKSLRLNLGALDAGSVGKETFKLIRNLDYFDDIILNVNTFSADSKGLVAAMKNDEADITINWLATGFIDDNSSFMEPVKINSEYVSKVPIAIGLLKYSTSFNCANQFLDVVDSDEGKAVFKRYGFRD